MTDSSRVALVTGASPGISRGCARSLAMAGFDPASHPIPMAFSGRNIDAPSVAVDVGLLDSQSLPDPYEPSHWGLPSRGSLGG